MIFDFGGDHIDVSAIDANTLLGGNQHFALDADGVFSAGEIRQTVISPLNAKAVDVTPDVLLEFNVDNDPAAEMSILVKDHGLLTAGDFVL